MSAHRHFWWGREGRAIWVAPVAGSPLVSRVNCGSQFHRPWAPGPPSAPDCLRAPAWGRSLTCYSWGLHVPQGPAARETSTGSGIYSPLLSSSVTGRCCLANACGASMGRPRPEATHPPGVERTLPLGRIALQSSTSLAPQEETMRSMCPQYQPLILTLTLLTLTALGALTLPRLHSVPAAPPRGAGRDRLLQWPRPTPVRRFSVRVVPLEGRRLVQCSRDSGRHDRPSVGWVGQPRSQRGRHHRPGPRPERVRHAAGGRMRRPCAPSSPVGDRANSMAS
jgi:hypothetical protein